MAINAANPNDLARLTLVASDMSYGGLSVPVGEPLRTYAEDGPEVPNPYDAELATSGYFVLDRFQHNASGYKAIVFSHVQTRDLIVAFAGTDGLNPTDWWANVTHYGWNQWDANGDQLLAFLDTVIAQRPVTARIHFTGQSLGGAIAQYAAYGFAVGNTINDTRRVTLTTFNALGGLAALKNDLGTTFTHEVAQKFGSVRHYFNPNDIVVRLGGGHVGLSTYELPFRPGGSVPGANVLLEFGMLEGHRIESGFYANLREQYPEPLPTELAWFSAARPHVVDYLPVSGLQGAASFFANPLKSRATTSAEAALRLASGIIFAPMAAPRAEVNLLVRALADHARRSNDITESQRRFLYSIDWGLTAKWFGALATALNPVLLVGTFVGSNVLSWLASGLGFTTNDAALKIQDEFGTADDVEVSANLPLHEHETQYRILAARMDADAGSALAALDPEELAEQLGSGVGWERRVLDHVQTAGLSAMEVAALDARLGSLMYESALAAKTADEAYAGEVLEVLVSHFEDMAKKVANSSEAFTAKYANVDPGIFGTALDFAAYDAIHDAVEQVAHEVPGQVKALIERQIDVIEAAGQTVVVLPGHTANPFDAAGFDPDGADLAVGELLEGSLETFTAYLPYEAGAGGQAISFTLGGAADKLKVLGGAESELAADGTFTLTVAEGQREISFAIAALEDTDDDAAFTLSAQLIAVVDGVEVPTHLEQDEVKFALDARDETAPAGGMEYRGDWGLKLFPTFNPDGTPLLDEKGNQVFHTRMDPRYPPFTNLERDPNGAYEGFEQHHSITGLDGADHIWLGEFGGSGTAIAMGGDDHVEGMANVPNLVIGDQPTGLEGPAGNDTIEGGENLQPYSDPGFTREGERIEGIGDDILFGGAGDDAMYADRIALLDETLDPNTPALDQKGDWISGELGDDRIFGSAAHDALFGGGGADEIHGGAGDDVVDGDDTYDNWGDAWWEVDPGFFGVSFFPVTNVRQSYFTYYKDVGGDDVLDGGAGNDLVLGMLGDDTLIGGSGEDRLEGWEGDDQLFGGADDDVLAGDFGRYEVPRLRMAGANLRVMPGAVGLFVGDGSVVDQVGNDFLDGGAGNDQLSGEAGDDTLLGRDGDDVLFGDATYLPGDLHGSDLLDGGVGADNLFGNAGDDRLFGGADNDSLSGDAGNDQADGGSGDDSVSGGEGDDILKGNDGLDTLAGDGGADVLDGGGGNDQLAGGEGDDVLRGDAGTDSLDGGAGADSLYGGSGEDVLSGGDGNDVIDGGAGIDLVLGGAGDDTYVFGLGYGEDLIEDGEGSNRLRFGAGIAPEDLSAALDVATLSATIVFGAGDSATLNVSTFQVGGVDFAGGTTWGRDEFLGFIPALTSAGSESAEMLVGNENVRNELRGLGGDDILIGSANDDLIEGGAGADSLDGAAGSDLYVFAASDSDIDALADSELQARAYLDWYYGNLGIPDWIERGQYAGQYKAAVAGWITEYYDSFDDAFAAFPTAAISLIEPLPSAAPLVRRDDQAALDQLVTAGVLSRDVAEFGPGLALSDLMLSVTVNAAEAADHPEQPWYSGGTLSVTWGSGGFDLEVPGINYGFAGSDLLTDGSGPQSDVPGAWRGYRLGEGIEEFRFADGTTYSLEEVLRQAAVIEVASDYQLSRDSGPRLVSRNYASIVFDPDVRSDEVSVSRDGADLLITVGAGGAQARVVGWYDDPDSMPSLSLTFASDPEIDAATLTQMGLEIAGSEDDDVIAGLDGFDDVLSGGAGSDILDGGTGRDAYLFNAGDGVDTVAEAPSVAGEASIIKFGPGIFPWTLELGLGSLLLGYGEGDAIRFSAFDAHDPYSTPVFERLEFDDGRVMSYEEVLDFGFTFVGTDGDDSISGTGARDFMDGGAGDDTLAAGPGDNEQMFGGLGSDTYIYAPGDGYYDMIAESEENPGDVDTLRLTGGILPADVHVTRDQWSYWLVFGDGDVLVIDSMVMEPASVVERIEFDDGTFWTPDDLAGRVDLLPGTALGDALWGTAGNDTLQALGGDDQLFGNGGNDVLVGGEGGDLYYFAIGDGADVVDNYDTDASADTIYFADASSTDATLAKSGNDLVIRIGEGADRVTLSGWYGGAERKVDEVVFVGDFVGWNAATLEELAPAGSVNRAPEVTNPLADQAALEDQAVSFAIPQGSFADPDEDDLAYGATHPAWLSFDPDSRTFSGTPQNADVGTFEVTVTAVDTGGESVSDSFTLEVVNANDAPVVAGVIADVHGREGEALAFHVSPGIFSDPDANDHLSLAATMANGSELPGWLSFDGTSFGGTPGLSDAGEYVIEVTARDDAGASADASFRLLVEDTPVPDPLVGTRHKDVLHGTAADEVLVGLGGNDELRGGRGDDVYVHGRRDGHDEIVEAGGDFDVIRFGEGITREMVRPKRHHDDLVLDVSGPHGSVTVRGWFASQARRVEFVQFANGTVWDEPIIRRLVRKGDSDDDHPHKHPDRDRDGRPTSPSADEKRQALVDWYRGRDSTAAAIWDRLSAGPSFDFDALLREPGSRQAAPDPQEIARQWARAHSYASALTFEADESASSGWQSAAPKLAGASAAGFGFEASIGATRGQEGLRALEGLTEGFRKL